MNKIKEKKQEWEKNVVEKTLKKFPEQKSEFATTSDIDINRLYIPETLDENYYLKNIGFPGEYPFTRGVQPTMYRGRFWTMRQYAGFASAEETNKRFRFLLEQGQTGLSVAFDLPTQMGYDSDAPLAEGEVGKCGVAIDSIKDMEILFDNIPLDKVSTSMTINAPAAILLAMYIVVAERQGAAVDKLDGTIQNDILKEYAARGTYIFPPKPSMRIITDIFQFCSKSMPRWNTISISGYHIREAGATAVQEVAFTLADGIAYVESAIKAGLTVDEFAGRLSFFFNAHNNLFEEIAKFRAARRIWAKVMKERFNAKDPRSMMLRFHTQTAGSMLTAQQPENNIVRVTLQALAAVLGGTQSLHTNSMDEALALPSEDAVRIALRTQQILACESGSADTVDPLAGSYYIEYLTNEIENKVLEYINKIDEMGGAVGAIEKEYIQKEIHESAYKWQKSVERCDNVVVGVNKFQIEETRKIKPFSLSIDIEEQQRKKLKEIRLQRDNNLVQNCIENLKNTAEGTENIIQPIIDAVKATATIGEICGALREIFGEWKKKSVPACA